MKQIFSSYPDGIAGFALLALRGSAAALLLTVFQVVRGPTPWLTVAIIVVTAAIILGIGTRPAVLLCAAIAAPVLLASKCVLTTLIIAQGLGLFGLLLLGPGAVSIDARLFGRRKIALTR